MKRKVVWSRDALDDLGDAFEFVAQESPAYAHRLIDDIEAAGNRLGFAATGHPGRVAGTFEKSLPKIRYIIVCETGGVLNARIIHILRVIHISRNWVPGSWPEDETNQRS